MEVSSEEPTKIAEATPQEQSNVEEEFTADGNIEQEGDFEEGSDFGFSPGGGFRGRGSWGPPRGFRGRGGFGPMHRGRPPFFRGRGGNARFGGPNFDPNWGPPPNMMGNHYGNGPFGGPQMELWVETKTEDGKSYFYHALSRETTWTRPEGPHVKIMSQAEVEAMTAQKQQQQQMKVDQGAANSNDDKSATNGNNATADGGNAETINGDKTSVDDETTTKSQLQQQPPNQQQQQQHQQAQMHHYNGPPPHFGGPQYGMPPPGYGGYPPTGNWGMPWQHPPQQQPPQQMSEQPAKNLIVKPGVIEPQVIARAAEWSEHRAPDGRPYYYHAGRGESVWEKPQAIRDLEAARMAAHAGVSPQPPIPAPTGPIMTAMQINATPVLQPQMPQIHHVQATPNSMFDQMGFVMKAEEESAEAKLEKKRKQEAEKKKKDEEEKAKLQAAKQQDKSRPISSTPIAGTPWCVVWTGDGRVFFYNPSTRTSVWERPEDLLGRPDVDKAISTTPEQLAGTQKDENKVTPEVVVEVGKKRPETESSGDEEETSNKKQKLDAVAAVQPTTNKPIDKKADIGKEAAMEAEVRAAKERALVPLEIRVKSFKEMLKEKDVSAFSTWEKELHKIVFDPRYLLLTSRERKQVFEKYVKERAEEERREKRNKIRQKRDDFRGLMEASSLHGKSSFSDFAQKYGRDERFKGIEKMRERESLFNEFIVEVRRREKDEKQQKKEQIRKDFLALLREHDIDRHSRWTDVKKRIDSDSRYRAVDSSLLREDYFLDYCKILKDEKKKSKDKERDRKDKKDKKSDKDKGKDEKRRDSKDSSSKADKHDKDNEDQEDGEHPATSEDEAERQQKDRDRQIRAEQSIKEREKEVQIQLAGHLRERDKEREHHKRDEAMRHFSALLADLVRNADLAWKEVKKLLRKDHRWELVEQLDRDVRERLFNEHIDQLSKKKRDKFREMLDEIPKLSLVAAFKDIKKLIRDDPRYLKYSSSEKCEREFRDYLKDKAVEAKASFRELLLECKLITHKSFDTVTENPAHLKEIEEILKNDNRYLVLEPLQPERSQMLLTYLEDLHKRGPPPPPTASESTRRNK